MVDETPEATGGWGSQADLALCLPHEDDVLELDYRGDEDEDESSGILISEDEEDE